MSLRSYEEPSIHDLSRILQRHRKKVIFFAGLVMLLAAIIAVILPHNYRSEAKLLVLVGRENVSLDPVVATGKTLNLNASRETEIKTLMELLKCRAMLAKVVDRLGADVVLQPTENEGVYDRAKKLAATAKNSLKNSIKQWAGQASTPQGDAAPDTAIARQEEAIKVVDESIDVSAGKDSTLITVTAQSRSPAKAQTLAAALVEVYKQEHTKLHSTAGSEDFLRSQKQLLEDQLALKREQLAALKVKTGIGSQEAEFARLEAEKAEIAALRGALARDLSGTVAKSATLKTAIAAADELVLTERAEGMSNAATDGIRQQLYQLELEEGRLAKTYTDDHPILKAVRAQMDEMRTRYTNEQVDRTEVRYGRNLSREQLELELEQQQIRTAEINAQIEVADAQWETVLASMEALNSTSPQLEQLSQEVAFLVRSYDVYADSLEQSRIGSLLTQQQISNVNVAQPASFVTEPVASKRMMILVGGLLMALLGSIPLAFVMEYLDPRLKSPAEVEAFTGLPVLASLPRRSRPVNIPELARSGQNVS